MSFGTPTSPELFIPSNMVPALAGAGSANNQNISVNNYVNLNGTIVTDRDYTRNRIIPEILSALESNFKKTRLKQVLGV